MGTGFFLAIIYSNICAMDISDLESLYETFDKGHGPDHRDAVTDLAKKLAAGRVRNMQLVELAAKLHDIGISRGRDQHEHHGAQMIMEDPRFDELGPFNKRILVNAVKQHRASTGRPRSIIAKIVSDADRTSDFTDPYRSVKRAYDYGVSHFPEMNTDQQLERALSHLSERYSAEGTARRLYFPESEDLVSNAYKQITAMTVEDAKKGLGLA